MSYLFCLIALFSTLVAHTLATGADSAGATVKARAWRAKDVNFPSTSDFPESPFVEGKPSVAVGFSGGGSRAYICALGQLAAFNKLGLIPSIRYIGGISGGSWAALTYTFAQNIDSDEEFLGPITMPADLTRDNVKEMSPRCARSYAEAHLISIALEALISKTVDSVSDAWAYGIQKTYLDPAAIPENIPFTLNANTLEQIKLSNPALANSSFLLPSNPSRPFLLVGSSLVGPSEYAPYLSSNQNFSYLEITPYYTGQMREQNVEYIDESGVLPGKKVKQMYVGGSVETFSLSVDGQSSPVIGLRAGETAGVLEVPEPSQVIDVKYAATASSYASGSLFESIRAHNLSVNLGFQMDYWSPALSFPRGTPSLFADGGSFETVPLISFLQRRVQKIVLFFNSVTPLLPSSKWNVDSEEFNGQVDDCLASFFGVLVAKQPNWQNRSFEFEQNQVFTKDDFKVVIKGLQAAMDRGNGIIFSVNLTTVVNHFRGIPAGVEAEVTFVYLGRLLSWEKQLNRFMHELLVPRDNEACDPSVDISHGPFRSFPHYITDGGGINAERANVLASLVGWQILQNSNEFARIMS